MKWYTALSKKRPIRGKVYVDERCSARTIDVEDGCGVRPVRDAIGYPVAFCFQDSVAEAIAELINGATAQPEPAEVRADGWSCDYSAEDRCYVARANVPGLSCAAHGDTPTAASLELLTALCGVVESMAEHALCASAEVVEAVEAWQTSGDHTQADAFLADALLGTSARGVLRATRAATIRPASEVRAEALEEAARVCRDAMAGDEDEDWCEGCKCCEELIRALAGKGEP